MRKKEEKKGNVILALLAVYVIWGSTYLAIRIALEGFPPFMMAGVRYLVSGTALFIFLRLRGARGPDRAEWLGASLIGGLLLLGGNGGVAFAEQWVASGLAALMIATVPLWTVLFAGLWRRWPSRRESVGICLGFAGLILLNFEGDFKAHPAGAVALIFAAACWSFGSVWSRYLPLPAGIMASAAEMVAGGALLLITSLLTGEKIVALPSLRPLAALVYLMIFGSIVGFSAYTYLLGRVRPAVATSYAYVNPVVAVALGVVFAGERLTTVGIASMPIILLGVVLVIRGQKNSSEEGRKNGGRIRPVR